MDFIIQNFNEFLTFTGFANASAGNLIMILVGALFIWLAIKKDFEPLLLVPIGLGIILGNIPFRADAGLEIGLYEDNSVLNIFYQGVKQGWYPPLVFLGIGAMTDFSALISNPKLILIGAAAQFGIFGDIAFNILYFNDVIYAFNLIFVLCHSFYILTLLLLLLNFGAFHLVCFGLMVIMPDSTS